MKPSEMLLQQFNTFLFESSLPLAESPESLFWKMDLRNNLTANIFQWFIAFKKTQADNVEDCFKKQHTSNKHFWNVFEHDQRRNKATA